MCGLVGMMGDITHQLKTSVFRDLLDVCQVRGRDSTGVIRVDKNHEYDWVKQVGPPNFLYDLGLYQKRIEKTAEPLALIGHCRAKTVGEVSRENAHPFDFPDKGICGVHNGTLRNYSQLTGHSYGKVDSEVLYEHLSEHGPEDTFSRDIGAFACVWYDENEKTVNFIRNDDRPLYFTWSKDKKTMFWASEPWMFSVVSRKIDLWDGGSKNTVFMSVPVNTLFSFHIKSDKTIVLKKELKIEVKKTTYANYAYAKPDRENEKGWRQTGPNTYERIVNKGGSVANPFPKPGEGKTEVLLLDDPLPESLESTKDDSTSSNISKIGFMQHSATTSDRGTQTTSSQTVKRKILSPVLKSLQLSLSRDKGESSESTAGSTKRCTQKTGTSLRTLAGMTYITDNATGLEVFYPKLWQKSQGCCAFCKTEQKGPETIGAIVSEHSFICTDCITESNTNGVPKNATA